MYLASLTPWWHIALIGVVIIVAAQIAHRITRPIVMRLCNHSLLLTNVARRADRPLQWLVPLVAWQIALQGMPVDTRGLAQLEHLSGLVTIAAATWLIASIIRGISDGVVAMNPSDVADNLAARRIQTQTRMLSRMAIGVTVFAGLAFILMTFPKARQLGVSLLASAGVIGLVAGIAAKSVFSNLLAGMQIALAQPIRIDDVVIVEGEWGRVEEITATYVVIKIWDERRLIVPLSWFIEHPFQNWTRRSADILGTVFLWVDYTLPVEAIRAEARRMCEASPHWDKRVCVVQVTDTTDRAMQLRILVSSVASGANFDLRCELREGLINYIQREHGQALPRMRAQMDGVEFPIADPAFKGP